MMINYTYRTTTHDVLMVPMSVDSSVNRLKCTPFKILASSFFCVAPISFLMMAFVLVRFVEINFAIFIDVNDKILII